MGAPAGRGPAPDTSWAAPGSAPVGVSVVERAVGAPAVAAVDQPEPRASGPVPIRPLSLSELLDGAFRIYKANAALMVGMTLVLVAPLQLLATYLERDLFQGSFDALRGIVAPVGGGGPATGALLLAVLQPLLVTPLVMAVVAVVAVASYRGATPTIGEVLREAARRAPSVLVAAFVVHAAELGLLLVAIGIGVSGAPAVGVLLGVIGAFLGLLLVPLFLATTPAIVAEGLGPLGGIGRSLRMARRRYLTYVGAALGTGFLASLINLILAGTPLVASFTVGGSSWLLAAAGSLLGSLVSLPFVACASVLVYFDTRVRDEGYDLELLVDELTRAAR